MAKKSKPPIVISFTGSDPTGGTGLQADIETLASLGCHCLPIITCITIQDTNNLKEHFAIPSDILEKQAQACLDDIDVAAFKIGMLGNLENILTIKTILDTQPEIPVIIDPMLSVNKSFANAEEFYQLMRKHLFPLTTLLVINTIEAKALLPKANSSDEAVKQFLKDGCEYVLLSGTYESTPAIINSFYGQGELIETFSWDRQPIHYHGAGCTLSAAIAAMLAQNIGPFDAVLEAQEFTHESLRLGHQLSDGQHIPNRFFWAQEEANETNPDLN